MVTRSVGGSGGGTQRKRGTGTGPGTGDRAACGRGAGGRGAGGGRRRGGCCRGGGTGPVPDARHGGPTRPAATARYTRSCGAARRGSQLKQRGKCGVARRHDVPSSSRYEAVCVASTSKEPPGVRFVEHTCAGIDVEGDHRRCRWPRPPPRRCRTSRTVTARATEPRTPDGELLRPSSQPTNRIRSRCPAHLLGHAGPLVRSVAAITNVPGTRSQARAHACSSRSRPFCSISSSPTKTISSPERTIASRRGGHAVADDVDVSRGLSSRSWSAMSSDITTKRWCRRMPTAPPGATAGCTAPPSRGRSTTAPCRASDDAPQRRGDQRDRSDEVLHHHVGPSGIRRREHDEVRQQAQARATRRSRRHVVNAVLDAFHVARETLDQHRQRRTSGDATLDLVRAHQHHPQPASPRPQSRGAGCAACRQPRCGSRAARRRRGPQRRRKTPADAAPAVASQSRPPAGPHEHARAEHGDRHIRAATRTRSRASSGRPARQQQSVGQRRDRRSDGETVHAIDGVPVASTPRQDRGGCEPARLSRSWRKAISRSPRPSSSSDQPRAPASGSDQRGSTSREEQSSHHRYSPGRGGEHERDHERQPAAETTRDRLQRTCGPRALSRGKTTSNRPAARTADALATWTSDLIAGRRDRRHHG